MKPIAFAVLFSVWPILTPAQEAEPSTSFNPRVATILGGMGNSMGFFGAQGDYYFRQDRFSVFGGIGYLPSIDPGDPSGATFAAGARAFSGGRKHRAFCELSVSPIAIEKISFEEEVVSSNIRYGPGFQVGYQFTATKGFTFMASIGAGYAMGTCCDDSNPFQLMLALGAGYTWQ